MKILILFYSMYGHIYKMAQAFAEGAMKVEGTEVEIKRVPETLSKDVLKKMGAIEAQKQFQDVPIADPKELAEYNAIIFGTPTRFGNMCGQMRQFLDATGGLWQEGKLIGKVGSVFTMTSFPSSLLTGG